MRRAVETSQQPAATPPSSGIADAGIGDAGIGDAWLARPLSWLLAPLVRRPRGVLALALVLTVAAVVFASQHLGFHTSRLDLLNPRSDFNQRWIAYLNEFRHEDDAILVVHARDSVRRRLATDALAERLRVEGDRIRDFFYRVDLANLRRKGLYYLSPQQLQSVEDWLHSSQDVLQGRWDGQHAAALMRQWQQWVAAERYAPVARRSEIPDLRPIIASELFNMERQLADAPEQFTLLSPPATSPAAAWHELDRLGLRYLESSDGTYGYVLVRLGQSSDLNQFARGRAGIERLRVIQDEMRAGFPDVEFGLTGLPVMELDEMQTSQSDMTLSACISLLGVAIVFMVGFGTLWHPLLAVVALVVAMAWSFAGAALCVGHLNILSVSFSVILIGLGIDFGIHFLAQYSQLRSDGLVASLSAERSVRRVGPAILSGGMTTALAFGTARFTEFTGVAELGVIAAQGIVFCIIAALVVLPALLVVSDRGETARPMRVLPVERWIDPLLRHPLPLVLVVVLLTGGLAVGARRVWYDHNLLHLQAHGVESVAWEQRLLQDTDNSAWYVVSLASDPAEILERKERFQSLDTVQRCEEIVSLVPSLAPAFVQQVRAIHDRLAGWREEIPHLSVAPRETLLRDLRELAELSSGLEPPAPWVACIERIERQLQRISNAEYYARVTRYQQARAQQQVDQLRRLKELCSADPPRWEDIPTELRERFVGRNGVHALKVYARGNIWDMAELARFVQQVEQIDAAATGQPIQTYYASQQMRDSYLRAAVYALAAVFLVLLFDFRSVSHTLLAMIPVLVGMLQMLGLMGWLNVPLNPANMIVLPLILGIGIDDGVHLVHDFRGQTRKYRLSRSTATAVVITSLTTMAGFGSMMLAQHQGLRSLGLVLTLGVAACLVTSLSLLPPLLGWLGTGVREQGSGNRGQGTGGNRAGD